MRARSILSGVLLAVLMGGGAAPRAEVPDPALAEAFVKAADELIYDKSYDSAVGKHYKVKTDDPRCVARKAVDLLESLREQFDRDWTGKIEMRPYDQVSHIYLFYSRFKYKQLFGEDESQRKASSNLIGHYTPYLDVVAMHTDTVGLAELPDVLVHEATHQLVMQRLYGLDVEPMPWIAEGMANYYGYMLREESGAYVPSKTGSKNVILTKGKPATGSGLGRDQARAYLKLLKSGEAESLDGLIRIQDLGRFYAERTMERYAAAWLLVRFLMTADEGSHAAGFAKYLAREIREDTTADDFYKEIKMSADELQTAFTVWAKKNAA
ncbi:MAG: hypothetical protein ACREAA_11995 [Candidatus Polarisedimenticolia bacterium]